ncbi:MAG: glycosyltransferase [Candidatus Omnitrophota bacterium]|nr:glycosyltransferase [Candidatus Omnitrophota bacterium]
MKLIYFSQSLGKSGSYQRAAADELARQHDVHFYGPGYDGFDKRAEVADVIAAAPWGSPDLLLIGHNWLSDKPGEARSASAAIHFADTSLPKVAILNKEYVNLDAKLRYMSDNKIDLAFTHHHDTRAYEKRTGIPFSFFPFAVDPEKFSANGKRKDIDLFFTGILRNPSCPETQTDARAEAQHKLFYHWGLTRLAKRIPYWKYRFQWRTYDQKHLSALSLFRNGSFFADDARFGIAEYGCAMARSRVCFTGLSPLGLVGSRYYEAMAAGSLVICPRETVYDGLFEDGKHCVMFRPDFSDFEEKLRYYLDHESERRAIADTAYRHVITHHTWEKRIDVMAKEIKTRLLPSNVPIGGKA